MNALNIGRNLGRCRNRQGLLGALIGSATTLLLLALTNHLNAPLPNLEDGTGSSDVGRWAVVGRRHLRNLPCPCTVGESSETQNDDPDRKDMMKLMKLLMEKLNRSLGEPKIVQPPNGFFQSAGTLLAASSSNPPGGKGAQRTVGPTASAEAASYFRPVVNSEQKRALYAALLKLNEVSKQYNYTWMLYSGTLLGSFRHHDMVPWDDDFDIFMNYSQREPIVATLSNLEPHFHLFEAGSRLKFWSAEGTVQGSKYPWKWPYLDISFFKENRTHIWDGSMEDDYGDRLYLYGREVVFPLHLRPMGKYFFPAPRDSFRHLELTYKAGGLGMCWTTHYSHKNESLTQKVHKIMCSDLRHMYPFVHRTPQKHGIIETLKKDGQEIHRVLVEEPEYAITDPYAVKLHVTL